MDRSSVRVLLLVSMRGHVEIRELVGLVGLSYSRVLQILKNLDRLGLVRLGRGFVDSVPFLAGFIVQIERKYGLENVLVGSVPIILSKVFDWSSPREISGATGLNEKYVRRVLNKLSLSGVVLKENSRYRLADDPLLRVFIMQIVKILEGVEPEARVVYRDNYCIIKEVPKGFGAVGVSTAFSAFSKYGIEVDTYRDYYVYPPRDLELEEVLVHSLLVARDRSEYTLVALLYAKNYYELDHEKLIVHARWYKQTDKVFMLERYINGTEEPIFLSWREFRELAELYNIDLTPFEKKHFSEDILHQIGERLNREISVYLFGGGAMVIKGYKTSTKDIDICVVDPEDIDMLAKVFSSMGYKVKSSNETIVYEHKEKSRIDLYKTKAGKLLLSNTMLGRAEIKNYGHLKVYIASDTDLLLLKIIADRPRDFDDAKKIIRKGKIKWKELIDELLWQEEKTKHHYCLAVLITLEELEKQLKVHIPYMRKLLSITTRHMVAYAYREMGLKSPKDIKRLINVSEETIRRILRELRKQENNE